MPWRSSTARSAPRVTGPPIAGTSPGTTASSPRRTTRWRPRTRRPRKGPPSRRPEWAAAASGARSRVAPARSAGGRGVVSTAPATPRRSTSPRMSLQRSKLSPVLTPTSKTARWQSASQGSDPPLGDEAPLAVRIDSVRLPELRLQQAFLQARLHRQTDDEEREEHDQPAVQASQAGAQPQRQEAGVVGVAQKTVWTLGDERMVLEDNRTSDEEAPERSGNPQFHSSSVEAHGDAQDPHRHPLRFDLACPQEDQERRQQQHDQHE